MGDQVIYLEKFVEYSGAAPVELNRLLRTIKELDLKSEELAAQIQENFEALMAKTPGKSPADEIAGLRKRIDEDQALLIQWAEEKVQLALTGHELLDSQMGQLELDVSALTEELHSMGALTEEYGMDDYAMDVAPPEPTTGGRRGGSRLGFQPSYDLDPAVAVGVEPRGGGTGTRKTTIPLSLSRQQSGYGSEGGYATGSDAIGWEAPAPKRGGGNRGRGAGGGGGNAAVTPAATPLAPAAMGVAAAPAAAAGGEGYASRRRAASAAVHATAAAVAALEEDDSGFGNGAAMPAAIAPELIVMPLPPMEPFIPGLLSSAKEPQAPGRPLTEAEIGPQLVGRVAEVFWLDESNPNNNQWYLVKIETVDMASLTASIRYQNGEMEESLSLLEVAKEGHMLLVDMSG